MSAFLFTSESVSEGHPDKICDQISDALVDAYLSRDPHARCAIETAATTNRVVLLGEVRGPDDMTPDSDCITSPPGILAECCFLLPPLMCEPSFTTMR